MSTDAFAFAVPVVLTAAYGLCLVISGQLRQGRRSTLGRYRYLRRNFAHSRRYAWWLARRSLLGPDLRSDEYRTSFRNGQRRR